MSYSRSSRAYPIDMRNLIERVASTNQAHSVELESRAKAGGLRNRFYAYKVAVQNDAGAPPKWMTPEEVTDMRQFLRVFDSVEFLTRGNFLVVAPRDESDIGAALRGATPVASEPLTGVVPKPKP